MDADQPTKKRPTYDKKKQGYTSISVDRPTLERIKRIQKRLTQPDFFPPSMSEVIKRACTALEETIEAHRAAARG